MTAMGDGLRALFVLAAVLPCAVAAARTGPRLARWAWGALALAGLAIALVADPLALALQRVDGVLAGASCAV